MLRVVALVEEGERPANDEQTDEDPKDAVIIEVTVAIHKLCLAWVVPREEKCPGAHEKVGADAWSADHDNCLAEAARNQASDSTHETWDEPIEPDGFPLGADNNNWVNHNTTEEATNEANECNQEPDVATEDHSERNAERESGDNDKNAGPKLIHPAESVRQWADNTYGEDRDDGCSDVGEEFDSVEGNNDSEDQVEDAQEPHVFFEPSSVFII